MGVGIANSRRAKTLAVLDATAFADSVWSPVMEAVEMPVPVHLLVHAAKPSAAHGVLVASHGKSVKENPGADGRRLSGRGFA